MYVKKLIPIDAWQWLFNNKQLAPPAWITDALNIWPSNNGIAFWPNGNPSLNDEWRFKPHMEIATLEGNHKAVPGDWIIKGVDGELYPCKDSIFQKTYVRV